MLLDQVVQLIGRDADRGRCAWRHDLVDDLHDSSFECLSLFPGFPDVEDPEDSGVVVEARGVDDQPSTGGPPRTRSEIAS